ncbi:hypothetical protein Pvag_1303 [Pantoea vagans C9-1]|nr:hypothetical protein Pvag_1303 [Pantoea vagans C9-1]
MITPGNHAAHTLIIVIFALIQRRALIHSSVTGAVKSVIPYWSY